MNKYPTTQGHFTDDQGLNGLFSWIGKALRTVSSIIKPFFPQISNVLDDLSDGDGQFMGFGTGNWAEGGFMGNGFGGMNGSLRSAIEEYVSVDLPLTPMDEANLDNWLVNNYLPYIDPLMRKLDGYKFGIPSMEEFIVFYNKLSQITGVLVNQQHYDIKNGVEGLTDNAVKTRNAFLQTQVETIRATLNEFAEERQMNITQNRVTVDIYLSKFAELGFTNKSVISVRYAEIVEIDGENVVYEEQTDNGSGDGGSVDNGSGDNGSGDGGSVDNGSGDGGTREIGSGDGGSKIGKNLLIAAAAGYFISKAVNK